MSHRQIVLGFDKPVTCALIAKLLKAHFKNVEVGSGITENGLSEHTIYIHNKEAQNARAKR